MMGWSMIIFSIGNMAFPNLYFVVANMAPEILSLFKPKDKKRITKNFELRRQEFIERCGLKLKEEFKEAVRDQKDEKRPRIN